MIYLAIIEDDSDVRDSLYKYFSSDSGFFCQPTSGSVEEFLERDDLVDTIDVILLDIGLPGISGIEGIKFIKEKYPDVNILMITVFEQPDKIFQSILAGAHGYLIKSSPLPKIKEAVEDLYSGGSPITPKIARKIIEFFQPGKQIKETSNLTVREKEIVEGIVDGLSMKMIADRLNISVDTVRHHTKNIYRKLHVNSKAEVISKAFRNEL